MTGAGKGDSPRRVDKKKYDANYERIFGKKTKDSNEKQSTPKNVKSS